MSTPTTALRALKALKAPALAAAFIVAACLPACDSKSEGELLAAAQAQLDKRDPAGAVIHLKNVLEKNGESGKARLLLGRALLMRGDATGALVDLERAQERGVSEDETAPDMARAMVEAGQLTQALTRYKDLPIKDAQRGADMAATLSRAAAGTNDLAAARAWAERGLALSPNHAQSHIMLARLEAESNQADAALARLDGVLARDPKMDDAALLKSEVLLAAKSDPAGAEAVLKQMRAARPDAIPVANALIGVLLQQKRVAEAQAELDLLAKAAPGRVGTLLLQSQLAFAQGRYAASAEAAAQVLAGQPQLLRALLLAGAAEYQLQRWAAAEGYLAKAVKVAPNQLAAQHLLARIYVRTEQPDKAMALLQASVSGKTPDATSLRILGQAQLLAGDTRQAEESFARAAKADPGASSAKSALAVLKYARGDEAALGELQALAAADAGTSADMALVNLKLRQNDFKGALAAAETMARKEPQAAMPLVVKGRIQASMGQADEARRNFDAALARSPGLFAAVQGLAGLDERAGRVDQAQQRYQALAKSNPKDFAARAALAELAARTGATDLQVNDLWRAAVKADASQASTHLGLIDALMSQGQPRAALGAAQEAAAALPDNAAVLAALGRTQLAAGEAQSAISTYKKLIVQQPRVVNHHVRLAEGLASARDVAAARAAADRALELAPNDPAAVHMRAIIAVIEGKPEAAIEMARAAQRRAPADAMGYALEGELWANAGQWLQASKAYGEALKRAPSSEHAINRHISLSRSGQAAEAERFAAEWTRGHARDAQFLFYLGDAATNRQDWAKAEARYKEVLALRPRHAAAMNNIAWLLAKQGKPGAVAMARQAVDLLPDRPGFLDTLSTALESERQPEKALEAQKRAVELDAKEPMLRWRLAKLLAAQGDKSEAKKQLEILAGMGPRFGLQDQAAALMKTL